MSSRSFGDWSIARRRRLRSSTEPTFTVSPSRSLFQLGTVVADAQLHPSPSGTIHGSAAPTLETHPLDPYAIDQWNLNNLSLLPDSLLRYVKTAISGCTVPWIYIGHLFSAFCWHNEDHFTHSINYSESASQSLAPLLAT